MVCSGDCGGSSSSDNDDNGNGIASGVRILCIVYFIYSIFLLYISDVSALIHFYLWHTLARFVTGSTTESCIFTINAMTYEYRNLPLLHALLLPLLLHCSIFGTLACAIDLKFILI